jgi:hypothetical protein
MQKIFSRDLKSPEDFSGIGARKKATARTSCCNIHNANPATMELTTAETLACAWVHQHRCQQQRKGEDLGHRVGNKVLKLRLLSKKQWRIGRVSGW